MAKAKKKKLPIKQGIFTGFIILVFWCVFWIADGLQPIRLPESNHPPALYANQMKDDLRQVVIAGIGQAKQSVLLIIYSLTDEAVIQALSRKAGEGIPVKVICDAKASPNISKRIGPKVELLRRFSPGLMHQKILAIDGKQVWIGSANMTGESLRLHGNLITVLQSPELAAMVHHKASQMGEYDTAGPVPMQEFSLAGQRTEMWFLPDNRQAVKRLLDLVDTAKKTVRVAMFTWTRHDLAQAVIKAKKRGVETEVILDRQSTQNTNAKIAAMLKKGGIPVAVSQGNALLHHKFMYIDGKILVNGSANWTKAAFTKNDDCFIILHELNDKQRQQMDGLWDILKLESTPMK